MERRSSLVPDLGESRDPFRPQSIARGRRSTRGDQRCDREDRMNETNRHKARLVLTGHIIDSMILPQVMDLVMDLGGNFTIEELRVGQHKTDPSYCRMEVVASSAEQLERIVRAARQLGATAETETPARLEMVKQEG